jgi:Fe-S-cluster containining protein
MVLPENKMLGLKLFHSFSMAGFIRFLRYKYFGHDILISGKCIQCGDCCRELVLNIKGAWVTDPKLFKELAEKNPNYKRFQVKTKGLDGLVRFSCTWLTDGNLCKDHLNRLKICRSFPDRDMFFMNGVLPNNCGYAMKQGVPFEKVLKKKMKKRPKRARYFNFF